MKKKNTQSQIRILDEDLTALEAAAEARVLEPTKAILDMMASFATAQKTHGKRLLWPVELVHFVARCRAARTDTLELENNGEAV